MPRIQKRVKFPFLPEKIRIRTEDDEDVQTFDADGNEAAPTVEADGTVVFWVDEGAYDVTAKEPDYQSFVTQRVVATTPHAPGGGGGSVKVVRTDVVLGTQPAGQTEFAYYPVSDLGERLLISKFVITPDGTGQYDIDVRSDSGTGETYLAALNADGVYEITIPIYIEGDADGVVWIGLKNKGGAARSYTLTALRAEKFA